jgi:uncharacterized protein (TIGR00303 family)
MIRIYSHQAQAESWLANFQERPVIFACGLGFTATALVPNISAAGATPESRQYTAIADAEFVQRGFSPTATYPLPALTVGASPAILSRAILQTYDIPCYLFNTGLAIAPDINALKLIETGGQAAQCVSTGQALPLGVVQNLFTEGMDWGEQFLRQHPGRSPVLGECVVAGTTTALAVLTGLGYDAQGKVNSSHLQCNHGLKWDIVQRGLAQAKFSDSVKADPLAIVAAVGDPMQPFIAGMAIAMSRQQTVLLAGGTQMLAVYALLRAIAQYHALDFQAANIAVGTTRWVAEDPSGDTPGLANLIGDVPLLATQLNLAHSQYPQLRAYEAGYVKEGVGLGGLAIAASLAYSATQNELLNNIEKTFTPYYQHQF